MRCALAIAVAMLCGCFTKPGAPATGDGGTGDATGPCTAWGPWGTPVSLDTLASPVDDDHAASLSGDGRRIVWKRENSSGTPHLWEAAWDDASGTFGTPWLHTEMENIFSESPLLSADGLTLWYTEYTGSFDVMVVTRRSPGDMFDVGSRTVVAPFNTSANELGLTLTADLLTAALMIGADANNRDVSIATRTTVSSPFGTPEATFVNRGRFNCCPALSPDGLTLLFVADIPPYKVYSETRASLQDPFSTPPIIYFPLDDNLNENIEPKFSWDGAHLVFNRRSSGAQAHLFMMSRDCLQR